jgi:hypothetical protein
MSSSDEHNRLKKILSSLAKIRLRMKAHLPISLKQLNKMSEEIVPIFDLLSSAEETKLAQKKGSFVSSNLEKYREVIWQEDHLYLEKIYHIIYHVDELIYAFPFFTAEEMEKKVEEKVKELSSIVKEMTFFSERVEEKVKYAYKRFKDVYFLLLHPEAGELVVHSYFPNFASYIHEMKSLYREQEDEKAEKMYEELSKRQKKELTKLKSKKWSSLSSAEKIDLLEQLQKHLDQMFFVAKEIFYRELTVSEGMKKLPSFLSKEKEFQIPLKNGDPELVSHTLMHYLTHFLMQQ